MSNKFHLIYWKSDHFWLGKIMEHPEIMTQGESMEELEANIMDAYQMMMFDDLPAQYQIKEIVCEA